MDSPDPASGGKCQSGCCQATVIAATEETKVEEKTSDKDETEAGIEEGGESGTTANANTTKDECGSGCCAGPIVATTEDKSNLCCDGDVEPDVVCCGSTGPPGDSNTDTMAMPNTSVIKTATNKCGGGCCSGSADEDKLKESQGSSASIDETLLKDGSSEIPAPREMSCPSETDLPKLAGSACKDACCSSKELPKVSSSACEDACCSSKEPLKVAGSACKDACCSSKQPPKVADSTCKDACCSSEEPPKVTDSACKDACCSSEEPPKDSISACKDACCSPQETPKVADSAYKDVCCSSEKPPAPTAACGSGCCDDKMEEKATLRIRPISSNDTDSDCCAGKKAPCCDESCIDRLTARECEKSANDCKRMRGKKGASGSSSSDEVNGCCPNGVSTRQFYRDLLKSLGCLCRTVKSRGEPSCCVSSPRSSLDFATSRRVKPSTMTLTSRQRGQRSSQRSSPKSSSSTDKCGDACCETEKPGSGNVSTTEIEPSPPYLETGLPKSSHVILSVSGMTCVGCETKLQRSLATIKAIRNLKTSLVLCRAEFDLDLRSMAVSSVIRQLERMTEFKIEEIRQDGSEIEVSISDVQKFVQRKPVKGVLAFQVVDKTTARILFDPSLVGARDLVEDRFGAPLQLAPVKPDPGLAAGSKHVRHVGFMALFSAILTIPVLVLAWAPIHERPIIYGSISLVLATMVQFIVAGPFYPTALKSLIFSRMIEMDLLIVISTSAAYIFSVVSFGHTAAGTPLATGEFFETSTLLVTLIMVGRFVSALARQKAVESVSVRSLQTPTAIIIDEQTSTQREIDARLLQWGDLFRVAPESRVPTDGTVLSGTSEIDESMITGESLPVEKKPGSVVIAGSINGSGVLTIRLSRLPDNNTITTIANMVDEAKLSKPKIQEVADKVASYFVPTAIALGLIVFLIWIPIGMRVRGYSGSRSVIDALTYGITVIIVSCPCAVGLAVPMVIMIAGGVAAKHGCIFKTATTIEVARKTSQVVFDKTGTLTQGKLVVTESKYFESDDENESITAGATLSLLSNVKHPVAVAVKTHLEKLKTPSVTAVNITALAGKGVEGLVNDQIIKAGNSRWLGFSDHSVVQGYLSRGYTTFCVSINGQLVAVFGLEDSIRPDAASTVSELQRRGISVSILSGDDEGPVSALARQLDITSYKSKCTPADKQQFIKDLSVSGKATTIFCGDGTNDAVALAQATIGVHMNEGTDIAQSAADVVLLRSSLKDVLVLIDLSKAAMRRIAMNFGWAFLYNTLAILLASGALVTARIPPEYAGLGELVSVLPVIAIAVQLRWANFQTKGSS